MTWPPQATRAEVLRILEVNRNNFHHWVISREETEVLIGLLRESYVPLLPLKEAHHSARGLRGMRSPR